MEFSRWETEEAVGSKKNAYPGGMEPQHVEGEWQPEKGFPGRSDWFISPDEDMPVAGITQARGVH